MDAKEAIKRARAAREFHVESGGFKFLFRLPSDLDLSIIYAEEKNSEAASQRVTKSALIGWEGVHIRHLLPDAPAAVATTFVELTTESMEEFFAVRGELFYEIGGEVFKRINARRSAAESAEKN